MPDDGPETQPHRPSDPESAPTAHPTAGHPTEPAPTRVAEAVTPTPLRIGRYAIVRTLGRGGMGVVYLARDARDKREVALKVIPAGPDADPTDLARFRSEAEAVARLDHPNIVKLFEVGEGDGVAYLAMEYVDGGSLYRRIKQGGPLPLAEAARLVEEIARATHFAHVQGVVHRDLKPSNILMAGVRGQGSGVSEDKSGTPKLADFGLAKQLDKSLRLTQTGIAVGTPHYMAPEQARGQAEHIGPLSDVHALGAILYELLVGHPPFGGGSPMETMQQVVDKKPVPPSKLRDGISAELEAICLRCLEKAPAKRYRTAEALADDLKAFRSGLGPDRSDDPSIQVQVASSKQRSLAPVLVGAILLAMLAAAGGWYFASRAKRAEAEDSRQENHSATRAERRARLEAAIAMCERGHIAIGLEQMRDLESDEDLPVRELIAAWEGSVLHRLARQPAFFAAVAALSPQGDRLATASGKTIHIWKAGEWTPEGELWSIDGDVTSLGWSEDGRSLAIGMADGRILCGTIESRQLTPEATDLGRAVSAVDFNGPGVRYTLAGDALPGEKPDGESAIGSVTATNLSPVSGDVAAVLATGAVRVYDADERRWRDLPPEGDASTVSYSSDGNVLAVGTRRGTVRLWDAISRTPLTDQFVIGHGVSALTIVKSGREYLIVACPTEGPAVALQCGCPYFAPAFRLPNQPGEEVLALDFSSRHPALYVTSPTDVSFWRLGEGGRYVRRGDHPASKHYPGAAQLRTYSAAGLHRSRNGEPETITIAGSEARLFDVDDDDHDTSASVLAGASRVTAVAVGPDGKQVCACGRTKDDKGCACRWPDGLGGPADPVQHFDCCIHAEAYLPGGTSLVLGGADGKLYIWDAEQKRHAVTMELDCGSPVLAVAASADGRQVLAGCADGRAQLWDLTTGMKIWTVRHRAEVRAVAFHKGDALTASADGTIRRWHTATALPLGPPLAHADAVNALAVFDDLIATGGRDRHVRVWRLW